MPVTTENSLSFINKLYGKSAEKEVYKITLTNKDITVDVTNIGCSIAAIYAPGKDGSKKNIVAGFADLLEYKNNRDYFGCTLGRYSNRIGNGKFMLDGQEVELSVNDGTNHLHGGVDGFSRQVWNIRSVVRTEDEVYVTFEYLSKDGEEGYPGNLDVKVKYILNKHNQLIIEYNATTDKPTPVNLSNHTYFNLSGFESPLVTDHSLMINASYYTEKNGNNLPSGKICPVTGTALNFLYGKKISSGIDQFPADKGFDHNFLLENYEPGRINLAATLKDPESCRSVKVYTTQQAVQLYSANFWDGTICGAQGVYYQKHGAVALETQAIPDSPNHASFPDTILRPGQKYFSTTMFEFGVD